MDYCKGDTIWFKVSDSRGLPGTIISENVFDMGFFEVKSLENGKTYLVRSCEIMCLV